MSSIKRIGLALVTAALAATALVAQTTGGGVQPGGGGSSSFPVGSVGTITINGIQATSTDGLVIQNTTPATVGVPNQYSPRLRFEGQAWDTDDAVSRPARFALEAITVSGTTVGGNLRALWQDPVTGTGTAPLTLFNNGTLNILGGMNLGTAAFIGSTGLNSGYLYFAADNQFRFDNFASTSGFGLDTSTNGTMRVRNRTFAADGNLTAGVITSNANFAGAAINVVGRNNAGNDEGFIQFFQNNGTTLHGSISGLSGRIDISGPAGTPVASIGNTGVTVTGAVNASGYLQAGANGSVGFIGRSYLTSTADKILGFINSAGGTGAEFSLGTPTLGTCTGGAIVSGSHNFGGQYTGNTSGSCVINFGAPTYTNAPFCVAMSTASTTHPRVSAASNTSITISGGVSGETITFHCDGRLGT